MKRESFTPRWGDPELDDYQWLNIPGFIMRNYWQITDKKGIEVGLTPQEFTFIAHIMAFKYDVPGSIAAPSILKIARRMGRTSATVHNIKNGLIDNGILKIESGQELGVPNIYDFSELVRQCREIEGGVTRNLVRGGYKETLLGGNKKPLHHKNENEEEEVKDSSAAGAGDGIPNKKIVDEVLKKRRKPNPWYDAVKDVWGYTNSLNGEMQKMLRGESKDAAFKKTNIDPPMTVGELHSWAADYRSVKLKDNPDMTMLGKRLDIQSEITAWRDGDYGLGVEDLLVNAPEPAPTPAANPMPDNILQFDESGQFSGYADKDGSDDEM